MASPKLTVIDLLQQYLKAGKIPPKEILEQVAQSEALQRPNPALDPIQLGTGAYAFGPLGEAANEAVGAGVGQVVPRLLSMAQRGGSGSANPLRVLSGQATSDLSPMKTGLLPPNGVKLPGGAAAAKGTKGLAGDWEGLQTKPPPTQELSPDEKGLMAEEIDADANEPVGANDQLMDILMAPKLAKGNVTGPLSPQGGQTTQFGNQMTPAKHGGDFWDGPFQVKTQPLTPFEAHEQMTSGKHPWAQPSLDATGDLPGSVMQGASKITRPLEPDNRTMPLESADIDEMTGHESPLTADLLAAFAKNLGPKDTTPLPENTLYHGMNVFGHKPAKDALASISQEGMRGGWFSEEPHTPFGPHFLATTPEDLPPLLIRSKQFNVDPEKEIIPRWKKMNTENLHTKMQLRGKSPRFELEPDEVKGRPAVRSKWPNIHQLVGADEGGGGFPLNKGEGHVVPPEKLFLTDKIGKILGRMAPTRGENAVNSIWDKARAFRNVLETGTGNKQGSVDSVFQKLFGDDPELKGFNKAEKIGKLQQFLAQPEPENPALAKIWKPFVDEATQALLDAGIE